MSLEDESQARYWASKSIMEDFSGSSLRKKVRGRVMKTKIPSVTVTYDEIERLIEQAVRRVR